MDLRRQVLIQEGSGEFLLPEWAASLVWLGAWCRKWQFSDKRLIVFAVLPCRELAAAFVAMGALLCGARSFKDELSWPRFQTLPVGSPVYWKQNQTGKRYAGTVAGFDTNEGAKFIRLKVTKPAADAKKGSVWSISERYFESYSFSAERPPNVPKESVLKNAERFIGGILGNVNPKWIWADGAEGAIVTNIAKFYRDLQGLSVRYDGQMQAISFTDMLCLEKNSEQAHAKLRVTHPKGVLTGDFPLAILDGPESFFAHEHLASTSNLLTILDQAEYTEGIHNSVLQLGAIAGSVQQSSINDIPTSIHPGVELAAYVIHRY